MASQYQPGDVVALVGRLRQNIADEALYSFPREWSACTNQTDYADGWCRQQDCPGFPRPDPAQAPISNGAPHGAAKHVRQTGALPTGDVTVEDVPTVRITTRVLDSFRLHHGGGEREAEVQLRTMLEDFLLKSARSVSKGGYLKLAREGYELILSPGRDTIISYSTVHRERTWEQVKAGVKSRFKNHGKARTASGTEPEAGSLVKLSNFGTAFDPVAVHLTARVRSSYAKIAGLAWVSDQELDATIRAACAEFMSGNVVQRDDGCFEVGVVDRIWLVAPDCRSLVGVKSAPLSRIPSDQLRPLELSDVGTSRSVEVYAGQPHIERRKVSHVSRCSGDLPPAIVAWIGELASSRKQEYAEAYARVQLECLQEPAVPSFRRKNWPARVRRQIDRLIEEANSELGSVRPDDATGEHGDVCSGELEEAAGPLAWSALSVGLDSPSSTTLIRKLIPGMESIDVQGIPYARLPRLVSQTFSGRLSTWSELGRESVSSLVRNFGAAELTVRALLDAARDAAVESGLPAVNYSPPDSIGLSAMDQISALEPSLDLLLRWSSLLRKQPVSLNSITTLDRQQLPPDIAHAASEIDRFAFMNTPALVTPVDAVNDLLELLDVREREVIAARSWSDKPDTLAALAGRLGVTREWVRQIQMKAEANLTQLLSTTANRPVIWYAHEIRRILGPYLPYTVAADRMQTLDVPIPSETASVLLYLAGPYRAHGGDWLENGAVNGADLVASAIADVFESAPKAAHNTLLDALAERGMSSDVAEAYLRQKAPLRHWNDYWIRWHGSVVEKAHAVLKLIGEPSTAESINQAIGEGYSVSTVQNGMSQDPRFIRTGKRMWGLRAWGIEEYSGIAEEILERIDRNDGSVNVEDLVRELVDTFPDIAESSVRMYLGTPAFVVEGQGVRRRTDDDAWPVSSQLRDARGAFLTRQNELRLAVSVTGEVQRGSGQGINDAVAVALGVTPGREQTFTSREGIRLTARWRPWSTSGPDIGSVRELAARTDAQLGDTVVLVFNLEDGTLGAVKILSGTEGLSRLAMILGVDASDDLTTLVAQSIMCRASEVRSVLRARGDSDLADIIPASTDSRLETEIESLIDQLR